MGFSIDNVRLLTLTQRKDSTQCDIAILSNRKMALVREQSNLSREYSARLQGKDITYYANGQYNKMTYGYLMGYGINTASNLWSNSSNIKSDNSMILTDANGLVVIGSQYVTAMKKVLGDACLDAKGRGGTFSASKIPALIAAAAGAPLTEENVNEVIKGGKIEHNYSARVDNTLTLETKETNVSQDATNAMTSKIEELVNFFYPIFQAAAANGWTTEYNSEMERNPDYISDALVSGTFQLEQVQNDGNYAPDASLTYFTMAGLVTARTDSAHREEVTAWYNQEKAQINAKESELDIQITDLSTELEAINTEIESVKSLLQSDVEIFNWCNG